MPSRTVLSAEDLRRAATRIAHEILESTVSAGANPVRELILLGIPTRGVVIAERIAAIIAAHEPGFDATKSVGRLDITMYRDDLSMKPSRPVTETIIPTQGIADKVIVLVDDVLYSGRTARAALDALKDFGRPKAVKLAVLVDRGHRELPIRADFVGKNLPTSRDERIGVKLVEIDGVDQVVIES
ncbi:bifunctional pyr operon transcriptional regulator/uracil phosphoribosyltransferase [Candidatus Rhodoluna planktonica]|uniref:Bifunctional protein PyrR n=1 Tax=Candidatus Rhodoluna planktonica TaxID=535712 RepID=A0A1D9DZ32_9MICO|nr:bifunctional pyr operon transcriptional regulator/uracil phosphoribosyltransferase PyrR [Candidatus Rhodoluna planktonica]AOY56056.1 bifunctional pyr operon transcriptional regulator/uracil phosphoribosyltransferase [Candidatus Rhodoluna planktonica]